MVKDRKRIFKNFRIIISHLVHGNILEFSKMFKDSHIWLQITLGNQILGKSRFPLLPIFSRNVNSF